jgi:hypothetical protein
VDPVAPGVASLGRLRRRIQPVLATPAGVLDLLGMPKEAVKEKRREKRIAPLVEGAQVSVRPRDDEAISVDDEKWRRAETLQKHRQWLCDADKQGSDNFDKLVTTLAAGALGVVVNIGKDQTLWSWSLQAACACFAVSLLAMLFSHLTSRRELKRDIASVDWKLAREDESDPPDERTLWHRLTTTSTTVLNNTALVALVLGICCLLFLNGINVKGK